MAEDLTDDDMRAGLAHGGDITLSLFLLVMQHRGGKSAGAGSRIAGNGQQFCGYRALLKIYKPLGRPNYADHRFGDI
jgi:hypothetical protein